MTYHYHGIDAEESILIKSLPNLGTWALPNLFFLNKFERSDDVISEVIFRNLIGMFSMPIAFFSFRFINSRKTSNSVQGSKKKILEMMK